MFKKKKMKMKLELVKKSQDIILDLLNTRGVKLSIPSSLYIPDDVKDDMSKRCKDVLPRDSLYENKHLAQELGIIYHLAKLIPTKRLKSTLVIDVGGGNGDMAFFIYNLLGVQVMVIDKACPKFKVDVVADSKKFSRIVGNFRDIDLKEIESKSGCDIYLVCKHLCGTNLDMVFNKISESKVVKGFVVAPCCYHKGSYEDFIGRDILSLVNFESMTSVTDWKDKKFKQTIAYGIGCTAETIINSIRLHFLENFYTTKIIEHVDISITPKNVLLIGDIIAL
jgi:hypothetical protein